jgi:hypothetical protein
LKKSKKKLVKKRVGGKTGENRSKVVKTDFFLHCTK